MRALIAGLAILGVVAVCEGRTITVDDDGPADFSTIQAAIDDSNDGDTVLVADGTYTGDGNRDIDFRGKAITVTSENGPKNCIIDCNGTESERHRGFYFHNDEGVDSILSGVTVKEGYAGGGGGIVCSESSPTITNCIIIANNAAGNGGGLYCSESSPIIENCRFVGNRASSGYGGAVRSKTGGGVLRNCVISGNTATISGGGIALDNDNMIVENCVISDNVAEGYDGGGVVFGGGWAQVIHCTIVGNSAGQRGGGLRIGGTVVPVTNCIVRENTAATDPDISVHDTAIVSYSNIEGGYAGAGNIDDDPCFADANEGDYHLKSQGGRWDTNEGGWTTDEGTSPCIDAGDAMSAIGLEPFPNGGRVNMGAYGCTAQASKSWFGGPPCETIVAGDINGDCTVDFLDFRIMALHWLGGNEAVNSNYRVEDGIEYYLEVDKFVYDSGEGVRMLYRVTNLSDEDVEFGFPGCPVWNFWVKKDGENIWAAVRLLLPVITTLELRAGEYEEYLYVWNMEDNEGGLVGPGEYDAVAGFDGGMEGSGYYDFSKVSVTIKIEP